MATRTAMTRAATTPIAATTAATTPAARCTTPTAARPAPRGTPRSSRATRGTPATWTATTTASPANETQRPVRLTGGDVLADPLHDGRRRGARGEDLGHPELLQLGDVRVRDDPAAEHDDVLCVALLQQLDDPGEQRHVRAGEHRESDGVGVLGDGRLDDLLGGLMQAGVDDLHAGVTQRPRHHLRAAVVPVQARLGDDDADRGGAAHRRAHRTSWCGTLGGGSLTPPTGRPADRVPAPRVRPWMRPAMRRIGWSHDRTAASTAATTAASTAASTGAAT